MLMSHLSICDHEDCKYYREISLKRGMSAENWHNRNISSLCIFCKHHKNFDFFTHPNRAFGMMAQRIIDLYKKEPELQRTQIAERLGTNPKYVSKVLIKHQLVSPRESRGSIKRRVLALAEKHPDYSAIRIAREISTSISYVKKILSD